MVSKTVQLFCRNLQQPRYQFHHLFNTLVIKASPVVSLNSFLNGVMTDNSFCMSHYFSKIRTAGKLPYKYPHKYVSGTTLSFCAIVTAAIFFGVRYIYVHLFKRYKHYQDFNLSSEQLSCSKGILFACLLFFKFV